MFDFVVQKSKAKDDTFNLHQDSGARLARVIFWISCYTRFLLLSCFNHLSNFFSYDLFGRPVLDQNMYYLGMKYTTATFAAAMCNILPALTFVMAWILR